MKFVKIKSIKECGTEEVFDIRTENHNYVCEGMIVHNSNLSLFDTFEENPDLKLIKGKYLEAIDIACKLEGHLRNCGRHAAGLVITEKPIHKYIPIYKVSDEIVTGFEKMQIEDMKLIKFDILGLRTLTIIDDAVKSSGCTLPVEFDNQEVYKNIFHNGNTGSIFQFSTTGLCKLAQSLKISDFHELYNAAALYRPGALHSGTVAVYVNRAQGKEPETAFHPLLKDITKKTRGIILYQESIMKIMHEIGNLGWATAEMTRKAISKSKGVGALEKVRVEFVNNAVSIHKMKREDAEQIFDNVSTFGCLAEGTILYQKNDSIAIEDAYNNPHNLKLLSLFEDDIIKEHKVKRIVNTGVKEVFEIKTSSGKAIEATEDHIFFSDGEWKQVKDMKIGDYIEICELIYHISEKIISMKSICTKQTYDIEMDGEPRNFIANNFVSHNSYGYNEIHALAYSILSYHCAFLKYHFPLHFYYAVLRNEADIFPVIQDANNNGIDIEYPHINKSKETFELINNKIYAGFNCIKGVAHRTASKIIANQPYSSLEDFKKRCKVSNKVFNGLVIADTFRDFNINKRKEIEEVDVQDYKDTDYAKMIYAYTSLKPKVNLAQTFNFGDYDFVDINKIDEDLAGKQIMIKGIVTEQLNKDNILREDKHKFEFPKHLVYLNLNDGTGNIAVQLFPHTYELFESALLEIENKPIIVMGIVSRDGKKISADLIQIVDETKLIDEFFEKKKKGLVISSATPCVSKKGSSYYRMLFSDKKEGLCFRFTQKLIPGMFIEYNMDKKPFVDVRVIKESDKNNKLEDN